MRSGFDRVIREAYRMDSSKKETPFRTFPYRVISGHKVLLRLADCADVLHTRVTELQPYCERVEELDGFGPCITEEEFNRIRREHYPAEPVLDQASFFTTLENEAKTLIEMYPLKLAFAEGVFREKASEQGMTVEEYIENVDFPKELDDQREIINKRKTIRMQITEYKRDIANALKKAKNIPIEKFGFTLQHLGCLRDGEVNFHTYLAGRDLFWETSADELRDAAWKEAQVIEGNCFRVPAYDFNDVSIKLPMTGRRDFREHSVQENILYCLENTCGDLEFGDEIFLEGEGVNIGIDMALLAKLVNPGNCADTHMFELIPGNPDRIELLF